MRTGKIALKRFWTLFSLALLLMPGTIVAEKVTYQDHWGPNGITLQSQSPSGLQLNFSVTGFELNDRLINGEVMQELSVEGNFLPNNEGSPNLPSFSRYIAVPQGSVVSVEIVNVRKETLHNVMLAPAPRIPRDDERGPLQYNKNPVIYAKNAFFPAEPVVVSELTKIRGVDAAIVSVTPFQYNPVTHDLVISHDIELKVTFTGGNGQYGENRLRSRYWEPIFQDHFINAQSLPAVNFSQAAVNHDNTTATGCEYLIIVPNDPVFSKWADSIKAFRTEQGILTSIVTLAQIGGNSTGQIETYINNAYNTWDIPPAAILIMADYGTNAANSIPSPVWDNYCVSDNIYADVDNNDLPDIVLARMTANNEEQLKTMVEKFLQYERNPPTAPSFYSKPVTALGWQTERWFQICSEVIGGFFKNVQGKQPVRINAVYQGNPNSDPWSTATNTSTVVNYFGPSGLGYIPATPQELGGFTGGTAQMVNDALNAGAFILQHRDHGMETGWGEPSYTNTNINGLTNIGKLSYIFSVNCLTGKYNWNNECFAEKFHRYKYNNQYAGALGILAASETSYSFVNDTYVWGLYDNLWPNFMPGYGSMYQERGLMPAFGNAAGKYFLAQSSWPSNPGNKTVTYHLFHHHGDAFLTLYSEVPQQLTVTHPQIMMSNATSVYVTANEGSFIALTANGQIIGTAQGTGNPVAVTVVPQPIGTTVKVVVTKTNYYRHYSSILVISPDNPYIITDSYTVNDPNGNNNAHLDFGESAFLSLAERNLGNFASNNTVVTVNLNDPYITFTDNTENYGTIPGNTVITVPDGFSVQVANNVPNQYTVVATVTATNGTDTWTSYMSLNCWAPLLSVANMIIDDSQGGNGNGRLDAGETAIIKIVTPNNGLSAAPNALANLSITSGFLTLVNSTYNFGTINPLSSPMAMFTVVVNSSAPSGLYVGFNYSVASGAYSAQKNFVQQVGLIVEDWETGDFTKFNWSHGGIKPWEIINVNPYEGVFSAKSGAITHNQSSQLILQYDVPSSDTIRFQYKMSSEANKDYLKFYIDNVVKGMYSGSTGWLQASFPITAGSHTFKWIYSKDGSGSSGADGSYLDFIILPAPQVTTAYAGPDGAVCQGSTFQCSGNAANYSSISWVTSGTGTFSNPGILNPIYSPSALDFASGSVTLTLSVTGVSGTSTDELLLVVQNPPTANAGANTSVCEGNSIEITSATASNYTQLNWSSSGSGIFSSPGSLVTHYTPSLADVAAGNVILTLTASNQACPQASSGINLAVYALPATLLSGVTEVCQSAETVYSTPEHGGNTYQWTVTGGSITGGTGTNTIHVLWNGAAQGMVTLTESTPHCSREVSIPVVINDLPNPAISGSATLCQGQTSVYNTPVVAGHSYNWSYGGAFVSGEYTHEATISWENAGNYTLVLSETNDLTQCVTTVSIPVTVNAQPGIPSLPDGPAEVDLYQTGTSSYSTSGTYSENFLWQLNPAEAGIVAGNGSTAQVNWSSTFRGNAQLIAKNINNCGESNWSEVKSVHVFSSLGISEQGNGIGISLTPNPNDGIFRLEVKTPSASAIAVKIYNATGMVVYEKKDILSDGRYAERVSLGLASGTYNAIITTSQGTASRRFVVK